MVGAAFPHFHLLWSYSAAGSAVARIACVALLAMLVGAAVSVCVVTSLVAIGSVDNTISSQHAIATGVRLVWPPATAERSAILLPANVNPTQPVPEITTGPVKFSRVAVDIPKPILIEAEVQVKQAPGKKRVAKKRYARNRWRQDRIRQRLTLMERLKPQ